MRALPSGVSHIDDRSSPLKGGGGRDRWLSGPFYYGITYPSKQHFSLPGSEIDLIYKLAMVNQQETVSCVTLQNACEDYVPRNPAVQYQLPSLRRTTRVLMTLVKVDSILASTLTRRVNRWRCG